MYARRYPAIAAAAAVAAGALIRLVLPGALGSYGGTAAYGAAMYTAVLLVRPVVVPRRAAIVATGACWLVEGFQLTGIPRAWSGCALSRWFLGVAFDWGDMGAYVPGAVCAGLIHLVVLVLAWRRVRDLNPRRA